MNCDQKWIGAELSAENAGDLLEVSRLAFETGKYGVATALAVLSSEESAKSFGLIVHALSPATRLRPLNKYFKSHKDKHEAAAALAFGVRAGQMLQTFTQEINEDNEIPETKKGEVALQRLLAAAQEAETSKKAPKIIKALQEIDAWHKSADGDKQSGFYVANLEGRWHSPALVTKDMAQRHIEMAKEIHINVALLCSPELRASFHEHIKIDH